MMFDLWPVYSGELFRASWPSCLCDVMGKALTGKLSCTRTGLFFLILSSFHACQTDIVDVRNNDIAIIMNAVIKRVDCIRRDWAWTIVIQTCLLLKNLPNPYDCNCKIGICHCLSFSFDGWLVCIGLNRKEDTRTPHAGANPRL